MIEGKHWKVDVNVTPLHTEAHYQASLKKNLRLLHNVLAPGERLRVSGCVRKVGLQQWLELRGHSQEERGKL